ncbi:MAG: transketolase [Synergistaceae bacterium]|nr:transketolase [Synergistaceae bacterium]
MSSDNSHKATPAALATLAALRNFSSGEVSGEQASLLSEIAGRSRLDAVLMTAIAASGHPGGSLSSMDIYTILLATANLVPANCDDLEHDRVVVSHGHTSPGVYGALAEWGFFDRDEAVANFRRAGSAFQGHVERAVPGVDWGTGNLGQGLSAAVGFALADKACGRSSKVFVVMGDGEQPKGQNAEARRIASKEGLSSITVLIDYNHIQISGSIESVMPADIRALWSADGWEVIESDGHDYKALYATLKKAVASPKPVVILCHTVMGKGVSFMEGTHEYHGKPTSGELTAKAVAELGGDIAEAEKLKELRKGPAPKGREVKRVPPSLDVGDPIVYTASDKKDNRGAFGTALADVAERNLGDTGRTPIVAFDCDLASSVKTDIFSKKVPSRFIQCGIQEHCVATAAGAASTAGVVAVWADFGVFGIDEAYNQQRLNDINHAQVKTVLTHVGLDVGEDGVTHQCVDYVGLPNNMFGYKVVVPADPNQTDRATRWMLAEPSNVCLAVGRSVLPVILKEDGSPLFDEKYTFEYGAIDVIRTGTDVAILTMGHVAGLAVKAAESLAVKGVKAQVLHCASPLGMDAAGLIRLVGQKPLVTCEDHNVNTGLGAITALAFARAGTAVKMKVLGVTRYGESGASKEIIERMGFSAEGIASAAESLL